jgi:phosphate:Na+ symporter
MSVETVTGKNISSDNRIAENLSAAVADFIARLGVNLLTPDVAEQLSKLLRAEQHLLACASGAVMVANSQLELVEPSDPVLADRVHRFRSEVVQLLRMTDLEAEGFSFAACESQLSQMQIAYDDVKQSLLSAGAELRAPISGMIDLVEQNSRIRRMARQMFKATRILSSLYHLTQIHRSAVTAYVAEGEKY